MTGETGAYRAIARLVARSIGSHDAVLGIYTRRSVAAGDVVFGRSDIDLHALVAPLGSPEDEGAVLLELARRYVRLKRLVPCLGHFDVSMRDDLDRWYGEQPFQWYRDRAWLRLYGEEYVRPRLELDASARRRALWWYFWAVQLLPASFRAGNARTCFNLVLDMFDAYRLATEPVSEPLARPEVAELWFRSGPRSAERIAILRAHRRGFRGHRGESLEPLYRESFALHEALHDHVRPDALPVRTGRLRSRVPPMFAERTYLLVDPDDRPGIAEALGRLRGDPSACVITPAGIELSLLLRNPWEQAPLVAANPDLALAQPPAAAFRAAVEAIRYPEFPRHFGFAGDRRHVGPLYAQARLYADTGIVAPGAPELEEAYAARYGEPLRTDCTREQYFRSRYPALRRVIDGLGP